MDMSRRGRDQPAHGPQERCRTFLYSPFLSRTIDAMPYAAEALGDLDQRHTGGDGAFRTQEVGLAAGPIDPIDASGSTLYSSISYSSKSYSYIIMGK
jgi:hypothetical protein